MRFDRVIAVRNNKTIYRDGDRCIKVFRGGYSAAAVMQEAFHQAYVRELGIAAPALFSVTPYRDEWAIEMQYIRGKTLAQMIDSPDALRMFAAMHAQIHEKQAPDLPRQRDAVFGAVRCGLSLNPDISEQYLAEAETLGGSGNLCHGDFRPSNVLIDGDGRMYVLDWPHAVQGDPCFDAAITYLHLAMTCGTEPAGGYLSEYTRITRQDPERIRDFFGLAAAFLWAGCGTNERLFLDRFL